MIILIYLFNNNIIINCDSKKERKYYQVLY